MKNRETTTPKCAHAPCGCAPRSGDAYCSEFCKHAATSGPPREETVCACAHDGCKSTGAGTAKVG